MGSSSPIFGVKKKIRNYHPVISWGDTLKNIQLQNMTRLGAKFPCKKTPHHESLWTHSHGLVDHIL